MLEKSSRHMKKIWNKWKVISNKLLDKEATVILFLLYWIIVAPLGIVYKFTADPLNIKKRRRSYWFDKKTDNIKTLSDLQKQF